MKIYKYICILISCLLAISCSQDYDMSNNSMSSVSLNFEAQSMTLKKVTTRGSDAKDTDESAINSLHIFIFSNTGNYLTYEDKPAYIVVGNSTTLKLDPAAFSAGANNATIFALANLEESVFEDGNGDGIPDNFANLSALQNFVYTPEQYNNWLEIPDADGDGVKDMPMAGMETGTNLTAASGVIEVSMRALMSRIDVNIGIDSKYADTEHDYPQLSLTGIEMMNIPKSVKLSATADGGTTSGVEFISKSIKPEAKTIYNHNGSYTYTFYLFENMQQPKAYTYPEGIKDSEKQVHKPLRAQANATNFKFTGSYTDYHGINYKATYTLYLGSNHTDNFEIKRNYQYKNNISITGLSKSTLPGEYATSGGSVNIYGFDAIVEIDLSESGFYVSMLRDQDIDAHASIVPMDIYTDGNPVKFEITEGSEWVKMEYISPQVMAANDYKPYTGIRDYFTTDLMNTLHSSISNCMNRSRIYFYVDENVEINETTLDPAPARKATICISSGSIKKYITLRQPGLRKVIATRDNQEGNIFNRKTYTYSFIFYVEEYEEYLNHYDPLDPYNNTTQMFEGLPWSSQQGGVEIGGGYATNTNYNADIYINGSKVTNAILNKYTESDRKYTSKPLTAAEYCNNKNKRNANGTPNTSDGIWYLPGITELEAMLTTYYAVFEDFQSNLYWSCAPAKESSGWFGEAESTEYARASKVTYNEASASFDYAESSVGNEGYKLRTEKLRIRAAYLPNSTKFFENYGNLTRTYQDRKQK